MSLFSKMLLLCSILYSSVSLSETFSCQDRPLLRSELERLDRSCGDIVPNGSCTSLSDVSRAQGDTPDDAIARCEQFTNNEYHRNQCGQNVSCTGNVRLCQTSTDSGRFFGSSISSVTSRCESLVNPAYRGQCNSNASCI